MNDPAEAALRALLDLLQARRYRFVTPTPATHARVVARPGRRQAHDLADLLGWSLPAREPIDAAVEALLAQAGAWEDGRATVRVSSCRDLLFLHSAHPTLAADAVFFGPDSYRFARLIEEEVAGHCPRRIVDLGTGAGVGAIVAGHLCPGAALVGTDVNPAALRLARINAAAAGVVLETVEADSLDAVAGEIDLVLANPPFIIDAAARAYRHGGGLQGGQVSLDMARMALARLARGGRMILYTGSAIVRGHDELGQALHAAADTAGFTLDYREIDPDVFGEELEGPAYRDVDRIALVAAVFRRD